MSSKSTIFYGECLHIYEECISEEICVEAEGICWETLKPIKHNEKYGSLVISVESLKKLAEDISEYFEKKHEVVRNEKRMIADMRKRNE